jgi:uncharacterized protein (DUF2252 family)
MASEDASLNDARKGLAPTALASRHRHLSVEERVARGKAARARSPRSAQALPGTADRGRDPVATLAAEAEGRISGLVPIRHGRMLASPFTFFRGGAGIMAADLAATPRTDIHVQLCGDAHLANFGTFGSPERKLLFDINDFDETLPGPWEWDVKRLAASFEVAGRDLGFAPADRQAAVLACVEAYRIQMRESAAMNTLDAWHDHLDVDALMEWVQAEVAAKRLGKREASEAAEDVAKARRRDHQRVLDRRTAEVDGQLRIVAAPPLIVPLEELDDAGRWSEEAIRQVIAAYRESLADHHHPIEEFEYVHAARKVVGIGSVGTEALVALLVGRDNSDVLFLQAKEAGPSALEPYVGASEHDNHGRRVVVGQRLMQAASDIFLGWIRLETADGPRDYYVRQLHDWKGGADIETFRPEGAILYGRICGVTLARAHARWGDRIAIASYLGRGDTFDRALATFAAEYADQNERDYDAFAEAVRLGRVEAESGV